MNKKVYMILSEQYMPNLEYHSPYGLVEYVFSSRNKAIKQMRDICRMINSGEYYVESSNKQTHVADCPIHSSDNFRGIIMTMKVFHSNGTFTIYTLQEKELNQGYFNK